jgi:hypothetical protein
MGFMFCKGRGVNQGDCEAFRWSRIAANQVNANAQFNLGLRYVEGQGVDQNDKEEEAMRWYLMAADQDLLMQSIMWDWCMTKAKAWIKQR